MKQFQYTTRFGYVSDILTTEQANTQFPESVPAFAFLEVGETAKDIDGDLWRRLPDIKTADDKQRDERLERIATAALAAIIAKHPPVTANEDDAAARNMREASANGAVAYAKALIDELDKQA
jgi:hypothetical protein